MSGLLAPKAFVLYLFLASVLYVHLRGRVRRPFVRQLLDHSSLLAPYNALMYLFSAVPPKPYLPVERFPELAPLREHWRDIRDEALSLAEGGGIRAAIGRNDIGFDSFFKNGWKRFYLKWYDEPLASAREACPRTVALLTSIPTVHGAMFALLPPGSKLGVHRDPFGGSLRYHLGLVTPNAPECNIVVDGEPYYWRDGEAVMFDETYVHQAENRSATTRVILFCDVERPLHTPIVRAVNRWVIHHVIKLSASPNREGEQVGALNRLFRYIHRIDEGRKRLKNRSKPAYYAIKWSLILGVVALLLV